MEAKRLNKVCSLKIFEKLLYEIDICSPFNLEVGKFMMCLTPCDLFNRSSSKLPISTHINIFWPNGGLLRSSLVCAKAHQVVLQEVQLEPDQHSVCLYFWPLLGRFVNLIHWQVGSLILAAKGPLKLYKHLTWLELSSLVYNLAFFLVWNP